MPPKRKNLSSDVDDNLRVAKMMKKSEPKPRIETERSKKLESEYKDTIKYDEYMESGIPSSLLEGLGFTESETGQELAIAAQSVGDDDDGDDDGIQLDSNASSIGSVLSPPATSSYVVDQASALSKDGLSPGLIPQQVVDLTAASPIKGSGNISSQLSSGFTTKVPAPSNVPTRVSRRLPAKTNPSAETTTIYSSTPAAGKNYVPIAPGLRHETQKPVSVFPSTTGVRQIVSLTSPTQKFVPGNPRFYSSTSKTVTKGNIVYERMPTGEVVASLVRKPAADGSGRVLQGNVGPSSSNRGSLSSFQFAQSAASAPVGLEDCPINEYNVGEVLEKSIKATQSMRMLLTSLRDDLRRIGAGPATVMDEQVRKRQEVADKLTKAYSTYKRSIEDIESPTVLEGSCIAGRNAAPVLHRAQKSSEAARPVMLVKNDAAIRSNVQSRPRQNAKANANNDRGKLSCEDKEVIELSESDDECLAKYIAVQKESSCGEELVGKNRRAQSDATDVPKTRTLASSESKIKSNDKNSETVDLKDKSKAKDGKQDEKVDRNSSSPDCNGHEKMKVEK